MDGDAVRNANIDLDSDESIESENFGRSGDCTPSNQNRPFPPAPSVEVASASATPGKNSSYHSSKSHVDEDSIIDEFGFVLSDDDAKEKEAVYVRSIDGERVLRREVKWKIMSSNWSATSKTRFDKIKERCRKGIPATFRGHAWQLLTGSHDEMTSPANAGVYEALKLKKLDTEVDGIIERDLGRTFPHHILFKDEEGAGQTKLRNIMHAYANIDPEVGYVQGMGFIAATLLTQMDEEEAFWCFHALMHSKTFRLRDMYVQGFPMLQLFFYQLRALSLKQIPKLQRHFDKLGVDPSFFAAQWFLTLFVYHFDFRALLRIWDIFMCEGWKIIFRCSLSLMKWEESRLLKLSFEQILPALKTLHENKDPDAIIDKCLKVKFKTEELLRLRREYESKAV
eukprot:Tbor_TRINITY_DN4290_c0_g1::TRINITY_DN4290_c0_g1_i1::g.23938::m.23938/K19944/TBC1D10; TBC1 domain family member 10